VDGPDVTLTPPEAVQAAYVVLVRAHTIDMVLFVKIRPRNEKYIKGSRRDIHGSNSSQASIVHGHGAGTCDHRHGLDEITLVLVPGGLYAACLAGDKICSGYIAFLVFSAII
jgi:hypothetical protein